MAFERLIRHYDTDTTTLIQTLNTSTNQSFQRVESAKFSLLREGGCGSGTLVLNDNFLLRDQAGLTAFNVGEYIEMSYDSETPWYFGRIESITENSPDQTTLRLFGLFGELSEIFPGGFGNGTERAPHRYARSDWFGNDPDAGIQSVDPVSQPEEVLDRLFNQYIAPATSIVLGGIQTPSPQVTLDSITFRGEESVASIVRQLATHMKTASYGVTADKEFFVQQKRATVLSTFQEGVDLENLSRVTDRSLLFNRLLLTGGYVYGLSNSVGFYRYRATFRQQSSITTHGERRMRAFLPWIRRNDDAIQFAREFFRQYAQPTVRYSFTTTGQTTLLKPWNGQITIKDASGTTITTQSFDKIDVDFDEVPIFTITLGPEDVQFPGPLEDQRFEIAPTALANRGDGESQPQISISSYGTFTGTSGSSG